MRPVTLSALIAAAMLLALNDCHQGSLSVHLFSNTRFAGAFDGPVFGLFQAAPLLIVLIVYHGQLQVMTGNRASHADKAYVEMSLSLDAMRSALLMKVGIRPG